MFISSEYIQLILKTVKQGTFPTREKLQQIHD